MRFAYHDRPTEPSNTDEDPEMWAEIAQWAEEQCEALLAVIVEIATTGCAGGVCANSMDACREMRETARLAIESYGRPSEPDQPRVQATLAIGGQSANGGENV